MSTLSIDIGIHNLAYAIHKDGELIFDMFDIDAHITARKCNVVIQRVKVVNDFINEIFGKYNIEKVIIERQVNNNTVAMEMMYLITATCIRYTENIIIFDPKLKFSTLRLPYDTRNKAHKKLSVQIITNYLARYYPANDITKYKKKDDIADSVFMLLVEEYKDDKDKLMQLRECAETLPALKA